MNDRLNTPSRAFGEADPGRLLVVDRVIAASAADIWKAFTTPDALAAWWGPDGFTLTTEHFDFRPGGEWVFVMHGPDGTDYDNRCLYTEIEPGRFIRYRQDGGRKDDSHGFEAEIRFEPVGDGIRVTITALFATAEERDFVVREYGALEGGRQTLARLAALVEKGAA